MYKKTIVFLAFLCTLIANGQGFVSIWNTENTGNSSSIDNQIIVPTHPDYTYNYTINWGDGQTDTNVTGNATHTYGTPGTYTLEISGTFPAIYFNNTGDRLKIVEILSWGTIAWQTMENAFFGCENMNFDAIDTPNLASVTSLANTFRDCSLFNGIVNDWDVSTITDISGLFAAARRFNRPLANWNVSNVTNMAEAFFRTGFNEPLNSWNVANVTNMNSMFRNATNFNQDISNWNVGRVTDMSRMFDTAINFNQPIGSWNVSNVTNMAGMFDDARLFNSPINSWNVANVTNMAEMFAGPIGKDFNQPLDLWNVGNVTNMSLMFENCDEFNQPIGNWNVANVTDMRAMFKNCNVFNQPLNTWNVGRVTNMFEMFLNAQVFNQPLDGWNVENVTSMGGMFSAATVFNQPIDSWNVSQVTSMERMFVNATAFNQSVNSWVTTNLRQLVGMFSGASSFNQPVSNWNVSGVLNMNAVFSQATAFDQSLGNWDISNVTEMINMLTNTNVSKENYDATLISWAGQSVLNDINLGAAGLTYCEGREERQQLIDTNNWTFNGDSVDCEFVLCTTIISPQDGDINVPANSDIRWNPTPNATGYRVSLRRENDAGDVLQVIYDNEDLGNVVGITFTNEFLPGDNVFVTVTPYNASGPATGCQELQFKTVESWVNNPNAFKFTVDTRILDRRSTAANQIVLEVARGLTYNYSVDWGDNQYNNNVNAEITHTYLNPGVYTISIIGDYPSHVYNISDRDNLKLISVDQWGSQVWQTMAQAFQFCENMEYNATDIPDLSNVTNMSSMFRGNKKFNGNINNWDVSNVTNMRNLFQQTEIFNQPLDQWDVGNVLNMENMFNTADTFNQPLNSWNVEQVTSMSDMFNGCDAFNQPLNNWNVSNVVDMKRMFASTISFNQPLDRWNVSNVETMEDMFSRATAFNSALNTWSMGKVRTTQRMFFSARAFNQPLDQWDVSSVVNMISMFERASLFNQNLNSWNVSNVRYMSGMFRNASNFNQPLDAWDVSSVHFMVSMFRSAERFNQNINAWNVTEVINMNEMFRSAIAFNQPLDSWDVNSVVGMQGMFSNATLFNQPIDNWNVSAVADMSFMFNLAEAFNQNINSWNVSSVTLMESLFNGAIAFNMPINNWNVASVTTMKSMFENATAFNQPLNAWNTREVLNMEGMFKGASAFNQEINNWNVAFVRTMEEMFVNAVAYNQTMNSWNVASVTTMARMFLGATAFNGSINSWNVRNVRTMEHMFFRATAFNQPIDPWRVANVNNMDFMFSNAEVFNQSLASWSIGSVSMRSMFASAAAFNQPLAAWDVSQVSNMADMLDNTGINRENYDSTLISWALQTLTPGIVLGAENAPYCDAFEERQAIIDTFSWSINGDVLDCPIPECTRLIVELQGAADVPVNTNLVWDAAEFARGYNLVVSANGSEIVNTTTTDTFYDFPADFTGGELITVTLTPFNDEGIATGPCTEDSFTIATTTVATVPDCAPLSQPANGSTDVNVSTNISWNTIVNASGYRITIGTSSGASDVINEDVGNTTMHNPISDLPEDTELFVNITPYNAEGDALSCSEEGFRTQVIPKAPVCTTLTSPRNGAINVAVNTNISWNSVNDATGYLVTIGGVSGAIDIANNVDVGNETTYDIPEDLRNDRTYYVTIIPYNAVGDALGCVEENFSTESPLAPIPNCTNLNSPINGATNVSINLTEISWNPAANASGYLVSISGTTINSVADADVTVGTSYAFANAFQNNDTVTVSITPYNTQGRATGCTAETFTIAPPEPPVPDCTTLINPANGATVISVNLAEISWNPVADAEGYFISVSGTANNNTTDTDVAAGTSYAFANTFQNNEIVTVNITPYNAQGRAIGCTAETFTIAPPEQSVPDCTMLINPANGATNVSVNLAEISWNPVADAEGYFISVSGTVNNNTTDTDVAAGTSYAFANAFQNNDTVTVSITPYNAQGRAIGCTAETFTIAPPEQSVPDCTMLINPANGATNVSANLAEISWNPVADAEGYFISVSGTANNNTTDTDVAAGTSYVFANAFQDNDTVTVSITPYNAQGPAIGCTAETFTIAPPVQSVPDCTLLLSPESGAIEVALEFNTISWEPVTNADGYFITIGIPDSDISLVANEDVGTATTYTLDKNLDENTSYSISITPYNAAGIAAGCLESTFTTFTLPINDVKFGFSPNGDGVNDYWHIEGMETHLNNTVSIYNRWGDLVFQMQDYNNTSNVFRGIANKKTSFGAGKLPDGTYFYQFQVNEDHNFKTLKGYVVIKR